jgi:hypothetical protein
MAEEKPTNWIDEMIIREAVPPNLREETVSEFCRKHDIADSTYYYQSSKPENQTKIINIALQNTKKHAPEILDNLGERAKNNSKDAEMYLKFILQLAEKTDITSGGKPIFLPAEIHNKYLNESASSTSASSTE